MATRYYSKYEPDGTIVNWGHCPEEAFAHVMSLTNLPYLEEALDPDEYYVHEGQAKLRQTLPHTLTGPTLSDYPDGTTLEMEGDTYELTDPTVTFSFDVPGTYKATLRCSPVYKDAEVEIQA